jgi:hypothetical protein
VIVYPNSPVSLVPLTLLPLASLNFPRFDAALARAFGVKDNDSVRSTKGTLVLLALARTFGVKDSLNLCLIELTLEELQLVNRNLS